MNLDGKTNAELLLLQQEIEAQPENRCTHGIWKYVPKARKQLDAIAWAITRNLRREKIARGEYVNDEGYSGRQTNR